VYAAEIFDAGDPLRSFGAVALTRFTRRYADMIVCCSLAVANQYAPARHGAIDVVYPPVSAAYACGDGRSFRARTRIDADEFCVACVGNISRGRGQDVLLRAIPEIRRQIPRTRCVIAGLPHARAVDIAYREQIDSLATQLGIEDAVSFVGQVREMADLYAASDVVVNPARFSEPFGRVAFEALMAGTPVVAAAVGGITELLCDGRNSLLFPREDSGRLAKGVVRLAQDRTLGKRLVAEAAASTLPRLNQVNTDKKMVDAVRRLVDRNSQGTR
jgi:D-inositol-3-phosphate glycosyltransferase